MNDYHSLLVNVLSELKAVLQPVAAPSIQDLVQLLKGAERIFIAGKGRSGLQMQACAMRLMHLGLPTFVVDDVTTPGIQSGDLLLIGSGSGRTPALVGYAQQAKAQGAKLALISAAPDSPIAQQADLLLRLHAPTPKAKSTRTSHSVQPMGTLFEQALGLFCDLLILLLMQEMDISAEAMFARHANLE